MHNKGAIGILIIGIGLLLLVGVAAKQSRSSLPWAGKEALDRYAAGSLWRDVQFYVDVAGREAMHRSLVALGERGGVGTSECWNDLVRMMEWKEEPGCGFAILQDLEKTYGQLFSSFFTEELGKEFDLFDHAVKIPSLLSVTPSFAVASQISVSVTADGFFSVDSGQYLVDVPVRFYDAVPFSGQWFLLQRERLLQKTDCYTEHFSSGDFSSCAEPGWEAGKQDEYLLFGIPGAELPDGRKVALRFAITLNRLNELAHEGKSDTLFR